MALITWLALLVPAQDTGAVDLSRYDPACGVRVELKKGPALRAGSPWPGGSIFMTSAP